MEGFFYAYFKNKLKKVKNNLRIKNLFVILQHKTITIRNYEKV